MYGFIGLIIWLLVKTYGHSVYELVNHHDPEIPVYSNGRALHIGYDLYYREILNISMDTPITPQLIFRYFYQALIKLDDLILSPEQHHMSELDLLAAKAYLLDYYSYYAYQN